MPTPSLVEKPWYRSKKFWATMSACLAAVGGNYLGIPEGTVTLLVGSLGAYVMGQGLADLGKNG